MASVLSSALYYPAIDINDADWLKTSLLFWDTLYTIVPAGIQRPYKNVNTEYLYDQGVLKSLTVNSDHESVAAIEEDCKTLLKMPEFYQNMYSMGNSEKETKIWAQKMSCGLSSFINHLIQDGEKYIRRSDHGKAFIMNRELANLYMMALANKLSEDHSLAMVTDNTFSYKMENSLKLYNQFLKTSYNHNRIGNSGLAQGLLLNYTVKSLSITPDNSYQLILQFKEKHKDELKRYKNELARLTDQMNINLPFDALQNEISNIYNESFIPAMNDLTEALRSFRIKSVVKTTMTIAFCSPAGTLLGQLGLSPNIALYAGAGMSVIASAILYKQEEKDIIRNNPYSYLLAIQKQWGKNKV